VICKVKISDGAKIKCNYELCGKVVNKSNIQSKTPSIVTHICDNIFDGCIRDSNVGQRLVSRS
jgi:hypothetical protein